MKFAHILYHSLRKLQAVPVEKRKFYEWFTNSRPATHSRNITKKADKSGASFSHKYIFPSFADSPPKFASIFWAKRREKYKIMIDFCKTRWYTIGNFISQNAMKKHSTYRIPFRQRAAGRCKAAEMPVWNTFLSGFVERSPSRRRRVGPDTACGSVRIP